MKDFLRKIAGYLYHRGLQMLFMGVITGILAGIVVTFYNILAQYGEHFSIGAYAYIRENPAFIPLLFIALILSAFVIGVVVQFIPMIRGSGIPQTEGAARGQIKYNPFVVMCGMFASSLACIFLGLSAGSEGPSIQIGGCCGYGSSGLLSRTDMLRRYQITGGACAGLAVAFNAPLTGMAFAFEETHKRFTPEVFICAFSSVIAGVATRNIVRKLLGLPVGSTFSTFAFVELPYSAYPYLALAAFVSAILAVAFYYLVVNGRKLAQKLTFFHGAGKMLIPFLLAGVFGLLTPYAMGGGHELIESLGTFAGGREFEIEPMLALSLTATLAFVLVFKYVASVVNMSVGVPCGVFIPMLAIGATVGALMSVLSVGRMGMDKAYCDLIVMICMSVFFTCIVRAPITGMVMVLELTGNIAFLLPVAFGVAIGYMVGQIAGVKPIYDVLLEGIMESERKKEGPKVKLSESLVVHRYSIVEGLAVKDIMWPAGVAVRTVLRGGVAVNFDAEFELKVDDIAVVSGESSDPEFVSKELKLIFGEEEYYYRHKESETTVEPAKQDLSDNGDLGDFDSEPDEGVL